MIRTRRLEFENAEPDRVVGRQPELILPPWSPQKGKYLSPRATGYKTFYETFELHPRLSGFTPGPNFLPKDTQRIQMVKIYAHVGITPATSRYAAAHPGQISIVEWNGGSSEADT